MSVNVTNGDVSRQSQMWAAIAAHYGMELGGPQQLPMAEVMPGYRGVWEQIVYESGLVPTEWGTLVDWRFADFIFASARDKISSTIKLRQAGFPDSFDSITRCSTCSTTWVAGRSCRQRALDSVGRYRARSGSADGSA